MEEASEKAHTDDLVIRQAVRLGCAQASKREDASTYADGLVGRAGAMRWASHGGSARQDLRSG